MCMIALALLIGVACHPADTDPADTEPPVDTDAVDTDTDPVDTDTAVEDDVCELTTPLALDTPTAGDTTSAPDGTNGSCTGDGREAAFAVTAGSLGQTGTLAVTLSSEDQDFGLYLRSACDDDTTEIACNDAGYLGDGESLWTGVLGGVPYTLFVDGYDDRYAGAFSVVAAFTPDVCGDGARTGLEACDDAQQPPLDDDGCSATCAVELDWLCANATVAADLQSGDALHTPSAAFQGSCTLPENTAHEQLWRWTAPTTGRARFVLDNVQAEKDLALYVRTDCAAPGTEVGCADDARGGADETLDLDVVQGATYTIVVDGTLSDYDCGTYDLVIGYP